MKKYNRIKYILLLVILFGMFVISVNVGSIQVNPVQLLKGLFIEFDSQVATVYDLRFPRAIVAMVAGAGISLSGLLFQVIFKNPLVDPGIIGISSGASLGALLITILFPSTYLLSPIFGFIGGVFTYLLIYQLSWKKDTSIMTVLLVGIALQVSISGITSILSVMGGNQLSGVASMIEGNISMKTWKDVSLLTYTILPLVIITLLYYKKCDVLSLEDKTIRSLGIEVEKVRFQLSILAVMLASIATVIVGPITFLGLIIPHLARLFVGSKHSILIPFTATLGALVFLLADTIGRIVASPYEVSASIIMSIVGGPVFIILLKRSGFIHGSRKGV